MHATNGQCIHTRTSLTTALLKLGCSQCCKKDFILVPTQLSKVVLNTLCRNPCWVIFAPCIWHQVWARYLEGDKIPNSGRIGTAIPTYLAQGWLTRSIYGVAGISLLCLGAYSEWSPRFVSWDMIFWQMSMNILSLFNQFFSITATYDLPEMKDVDKFRHRFLTHYPLYNVNTMFGGTT